MLKKISFFALAALIFVGCSSNEEKEKKKRTFKESVYAFVNSHPQIVGYGRVDVSAIMDESNMEQNSLFQMFAAPTYDGLKKQVDVKSPVYIATTTTEGHSDLTIYGMFKVKDKKVFVQEWTNMGFDFKEHKGISYTEDDEKILAANDRTLMVIMAPGDFDAKSLVSKAFKYTEGKIAPDKMKKELEAPGDFVMHLRMDRLKANDPSMSMMPDGTELDLALNFEKGKMIFETSFNNFDKIKKQLGMEMANEPLVSKKITDADGNIIMAMQMSAESKLMNMVGMDADKMSKSMSSLPLLLSGMEGSITMGEMTAEDEVVMPESGKAMGDQYMELLIDLDAVAEMAPKYQEYLSKLDYATVEFMQNGTTRFVVTTDEKGKNFLATVFETVDEFMNNGGLMQVMAMQ